MLCRQPKFFMIMHRMFSILFFFFMNAGLHAQKISRQQAVADLSQFEQLVRATSVHMAYKNINYSAAINSFTNHLREDSVDIGGFSDFLKELLGALGDRHASVYYPKTKQLRRRRFLPFAVAPSNKQVTALRVNADFQYEHYYAAYPFLKSVAGIPVDSLLFVNSWFSRSAPFASFLHRQTEKLPAIGSLLAEKLIDADTVLPFLFTNGIKDTLVHLLLSPSKYQWRDCGSTEDKYEAAFLKNDFKGIFKYCKGAVGYIAIPKMIDSMDAPAYFQLLEEKMDDYTNNASALIVDIRGNKGGTRDLIHFFGRYFSQQIEAPWVANIVYLLKSDVYTNAAMSYRPLLSSSEYSQKEKNAITGFLKAFPPEPILPKYLFPAVKYAAKERTAITGFLKTFSPELPLSSNTFSKPYFYVIAPSQPAKGKTRFQKKVYILCNERTFSAASVMAACLKGFNNIVIAGETTDGSSGRSEDFILRHSRIEVNVSVMLSFQRNGTTIDGNGTVPDLIIKRDMNQILGKRDSQLEQLIDVITRKTDTVPHIVLVK
jgi:Peptidase family S41